MHLNIVSQTYSPDVQRLIEPYVYEVTSSLKGSVSAEHGRVACASKYESSMNA